MAAAAQSEAPAPKKGSLVLQIGLLVALSIGAVGTGWLAGNMIGGAPQAEGEHGAAAGGHGAKGDKPQTYDEIDGSNFAEPSLNIFRLEDITTNLAGPDSVWVRAQLALVFREKADAALAEMVHQDFLAYLRTVKLQQVEGPSGLIHLKSDLLERANLRSGGKVKDVLIRTLLFE